MQVARLYTGDDGESHFEELDLPYEKIREAENTAMQAATGIQFRRNPPGHFSDFHVAPRRQYIITLEGAVGDRSGRRRHARVRPGDVMLADDLTGRGHTTGVHGDQTRVSIAIPLAE